jgi:hypothetical protein
LAHGFSARRAGAVAPHRVQHARGRAERCSGHGARAQKTRSGLPATCFGDTHTLRFSRASDPFWTCHRICIPRGVCDLRLGHVGIDRALGFTQVAPGSPILPSAHTHYV